MYSAGFVITLVGGTLFVLSASSWFNAWVGLELNMLSFIPLVVKDKDIMGAEAGIKYFLIQAVASIVVLLGVVFKGMEFEGLGGMGPQENESLVGWGVGLALAMKLGMAPVHFWFPNMVDNMSWINQVILLTWQKIAPLSLMSSLGLDSWGMSILIGCSIGVGGVGGLVQTSLAKLMAYSSITHMGWMGGALVVGGNFWMIYFLIYSVMTISVIWVLNLEGCYRLPHLWAKTSVPSTTKVGLFVGFLSMGGLPPFLGFFPKWGVVEGLVQSESYVLVLGMVVVTLVTLYYYFRVVFVAFVYANTTPKMEKISIVGRNRSVVLGVGLMGLNAMGLWGCTSFWV